MVNKGVKINWEDEAKAQIKAACNYIRKDSLKSSQKVKKDILGVITSLSLQPEKYNLDKYKIDNDGSYRAFELHHYRIVYRFIQTEIKILTIRHSSREPKEY